MWRYTRLLILSLCLLLMGFTCYNIRKISVDVGPKNIEGVTKVISVGKEKYGAVLEVFKTWMANYQLKQLDCPEYELRREQPPPELCESYAFDYKSWGLIYDEPERIVISIFYDRKIERTVIQLFDWGRPYQSKKGKEIEKELVDLMSNEFGKNAIQVIR
jgi:hypothetical protein